MVQILLQSASVTCLVILIAWQVMKITSASINTLRGQTLRFSMRHLLLYTGVLAVTLALGGALFNNGS